MIPCRPCHCGYIMPFRRAATASATSLANNIICYCSYHVALTIVPSPVLAVSVHGVLNSMQLSVAI
jgi:hypothetical protein